MIDKILNFFGYRIIYECSWGRYLTRYNSLDDFMGRPIYQGMSTAPPWAKMRIIKC